MMLLGASKNGVQVSFDPDGSHAATHFADAPGLRELVIEAIGTLVLDGGEILRQVDMGRVVGTCDVVAVRNGDEIVYGVRRNREDDGLVPFVKNRYGDPCATVVLHLKPQTDGAYLLSSAWIGPLDEDDQPFPMAKGATRRAADYWSKHAFIYGSQEIMPGTETSIYPW